MGVRIAIPVPTSSDTEYNQRSLPPYVDALKAAGAEPVVVPLGETQERVARLLAGVQGVLLPGSRYDIDPQRYGEARAPECAEDDPARTAADELLLQDAFNLRKPVLAICHGAQGLNVWRSGSLIQDLKTAVNHRPGRGVVEAHAVKIVEGSRLTGLLQGAERADPQVNSSHHQAIRTPGRQFARHCGFSRRWGDRGRGTGCPESFRGRGAVASRAHLRAKRVLPGDLLRVCRGCQRVATAASR